MDGHIRYVPFKSIEVLPEMNSRQVYRGIDELADNIRENGLLTPLGVFERKGKNDRRIVLSEGFRRHAALTQIIKRNAKAFPKGIPCMVKHGNDADLYVANLVENIQRNDLSPGEQAIGFARCVNEGMSQKAIADRVGVSATTVSRLLKIHAGLSERARQAFVEGRLAIDTAETLATAPADKQAEVMAAMKQAAKQEAEDAPPTNGKAHAKAERKAARQAVERKRPTVTQIKERAAKIDATDGVFYGAKVALEWAAGERKAIDL